jgi:hypothetical protein
MLIAWLMGQAVRHGRLDVLGNRLASRSTYGSKIKGLQRTLQPSEPFQQLPQRSSSQRICSQSKLLPCKVPRTTTYASRSSGGSEKATSNGTLFFTK